MTTFENPSNGYRETVSPLAGLWAFLFGFFYFLAKGLWTHAAIQLVLIALAVLSAPVGPALMIFVWIGYAFAAKGLVRAKYRRLGWKEVSAPESPYAVVGASAGASASQPLDKVCPRCAETIKAAAKACRFCGYEFASDVSASSPKPSQFAEGDQVVHRTHGSGFVVRATRAGSVLVRFSSGHEEVREVDLRPGNPSVAEASAP